MTKRFAILRVLLGVLFLFRTSALCRVLPAIHAPVQGPLLGWPDRAPVHAAVLGLVLPDALKIAFALVGTAAAAAFTAGFRVREAGLAASACGFVALAQDPFGFTFTLELLFVAVAVFAFVDERAPVSSVRMLRLFTASIYFWSAIPKLGWRWLSGDVLREYHASGIGHGAAFDALGRHPHAAAVAAVALELALPPLLLSKRTRTAAVVIACMMHTMFELALHPDVLGWLMVVLLVAFWPDPQKNPF